MEALGVAAAEQSRQTRAVSTTGQAHPLSCRVLDIVVAGLLLVLLFPLLALIAAVIRLDSRGWPIYRQQRLGHRCRPFVVNKFRTMAVDAGHDTHREYVVGLITGARGATEAGVFKLTADDRITRVGRFLRRSSLDELPQLWNVLRGDMSLVGPRPPIPYEVDEYPEHWFGRFAVKPGITGLWQVNGRSEVTLEQMIAFDLAYVERQSLWFNLQILVRTLPAVLRARGAA